jgi:hypothetical protein
MKARDWPPHMSSCSQLNLARLRIRTRITLERLIELLKINKAQTFISANAWAHIYAAEVEQSQPGIEAFVGERIRDIPYLFGVDVRPDRPERFRRIVRLLWNANGLKAGWPTFPTQREGLEESRLVCQIPRVATV